MSSLLLAAALVAAQATPAPPPERIPGVVRLGEAEVAGWHVNARTVVSLREALPLIAEVTCDLDRDGVRLRTWRFGGIDIIPDGADEFDAHEIRAIALDQNVWEYRWREWSPLEERFADVDYPPLPAPVDPCAGLGRRYIIHHGCPRPTDIGDRLVRGAPHEPWLHVSTLANELLGARNLRLGYRAAGAVEQIPLHWIEVPLDGLAEARAWCDSAMTSEAARRLHGDARR